MTDRREVEIHLSFQLKRKIKKTILKRENRNNSIHTNDNNKNTCINNDGNNNNDNEDNIEIK